MQHTATRALETEEQRTCPSNPNRTPSAPHTLLLTKRVNESKAKNFACLAAVQAEQRRASLPRVYCQLYSTSVSIVLRRIDSSIEQAHLTTMIARVKSNPFDGQAHAIPGSKDFPTAPCRTGSTLLSISWRQ